MSLETQSFKPKNKSNKNCLKVINEVKSLHKNQKEKLQSTELNVCAGQTSLSAIFLLYKIMAPKFINNPHSKQDPSKREKALQTRLHKV